MLLATTIHAMPNDATPRWFDAHLDLAYLAERGRDMHAELDDCRGRDHPAAVTLPSLAAGNVTHALATVFTEPQAPDETDVGPWNYPPADALAARKAGLRQLKLYDAWRRAGAVRALTDAPTDALALGVLIENADPIESPDHLDEWTELGVVAVGLTWATSSRYAAGNAADPKRDATGLTDLGRALVHALDAANVVHDLSHLAQRATDELLGLARGRVIASHSNARALMGDPDAVSNQRHLADDTIREIARRDGVIGINLFSPFLSPGAKRATIDDAVRHINHICEVVGDRAHIGLGSDMDGGFGADRLPRDIDTPADLARIALALNADGWPDDDIHAFAFGNWARFWSPA